MKPLTVSALAREAGVSPHTVRYYEEVGLLPSAPRSDRGYRLFDTTLVDRIRFIRGAKRVGLRLPEIAELLDVMDRGQCPCGHTDAILRKRRDELSDEIAELSGVRDVVEHLLNEHPPAACPDLAADTWWCREDFVRR